MLKTNVYNMSGVVVGEIELSEAVFGIAPNQAVVHETVKNHLANKRQGTQSALTRAEVSGGGRKPWRRIYMSAFLRKGWKGLHETPMEVTHKRQK